jgi:hypothetical protein
VPYTFTLISGSLPTGVTLNSSGTLAGTPKRAGVYWFSVRAKDAFGSTGFRWFWMAANK